MRQSEASHIDPSSGGSIGALELDIAHLLKHTHFDWLQASDLWVYIEPRPLKAPCYAKQSVAATRNNNPERVVLCQEDKKTIVTGLTLRKKLKM